MKRKKLLLADDDVDDALLLQDILTDIGTDVDMQVAMNGVQLMAMLEQCDNPPDAILLDLNMPLKNGMQCLAEIRARPQWQHIIVIILSTSSDKKQIAEAYGRGANRFLTKSNSYSEYKNAIAGCLQPIGA